MPMDTRVIQYNRIMRAAIYAAAKAVASAAKALNVLRARALAPREEGRELYVLDYKLHRPQAALLSRAPATH